MKRTSALIFLFCGLLLTAVALQAQIRSATIAGSVRDASGSVIANADVVVTEESTNISSNTKTTDAGLFAAPYLPAGTYSVAVTATGFAPYKQTGIPVAVGQTVRADATLTVGSIASTVEVRASAAQIQTENSAVQGAVQADVIRAIPNITGNPLYYATLQAGVSTRGSGAASTTSSSSFGIGYEGRRTYSAIGVNGGDAFTNDLQLDGLSIQSGSLNDTMIVPNTEGLQEVRVASNNFTAEYGRGQGVVSMSTKSGTNQYHGVGTYSLRNEALNANSASNNANAIPRAAFKVNEFGGSLGGPILKDKLFFFSSYQRLIHNRNLDRLITVPTALEKVGNYTKTLVRDQSGTAVPAQVFDPYNVTQLGPDLYQRAPYPGGIMPNPDKYGLHILGFYPSPNRTPDDAYQANNYYVRNIQAFRRQSLNSRIDYRRGKHSIYGSGGFSLGNIKTGRPWGKDTPFSIGTDWQSDKNSYGQIGDTIVLGPELVVDLRFGVTRLHMQQFGGAREGFKPEDYDKFGIPRSIQGVMGIPGSAPVIDFRGPGVTYTSLNNTMFANKWERQTLYNFVGSTTKIRGRWTHKIGGEFRNLLANYQDYEEASAILGYSLGLPWVGGNYNFQYLNASGTSAPQNVSVPQRGWNGAYVLTGGGYWFVRQAEAVTPALASKYYAFYSQNDWRANSRLTLNLGLRWDLQPGPTERYNRMSTLDRTRKNPFGTQGAFAFPNTEGYSRNLWDTRWKDFAPRLGVAYQLSSSLVLRGGFGISYLPANTGFYDGPTLYGAAAFGIGTDRAPYGLNPKGVPIGRFSEEGPAWVIGPYNANPQNPAVYGTGEVLFDRNQNKDGQVMQWNLFVEKKFSNAWFASAGYSASRSRNLEFFGVQFQTMQNLPQSTLDAWRSQYIANNGTLNPATELVTNPFQPTTGAKLNFQGELGNSTIRRFVPLLPYPHFVDERMDLMIGYADYHSMQLRLDHAFSNGFQFSANYTWSKSLDFAYTAAAGTQGFSGGAGVSEQVVTYPALASTYDNLNYDNNRKYSFNDLPHRFAATFVYELPFGPGRPLEVQNRILKSVLGRWQTGGVVLLQSGFPSGPSGASDGSLRSRPDRLAGVPVEVPKELQHWYDGNTTVTLPSGRKITPSKNTFLKYSSDAFAGRFLTTPNGKVVPDQYWWGTASSSYGDMRGPGRFNLDLSLRRVFPVREGITLEVAAQVTNLLNHTQYSGRYSNALGTTNLQTNAAKGLVPGMGSSDTFGTLSLSTYDPRQVVMNLRLRF